MKKVMYNVITECIKRTFSYPSNMFRLFSVLILCCAFNSCSSIKSQSYSSRIRAVESIAAQNILLKIALEDEVWEVRRAAFVKLDYKTLKEMISVSPDKAVIIAAKIRTGQTNWTDVYSNTLIDSSAFLCDILGATALVNLPQTERSEVLSACKSYLKNRNPSRIPELKNLLFRFGNKYLAEDFMNSRNSELYEVSKEWAKINGFVVRGPNSALIEAQNSMYLVNSLYQK